MRYILNMKISKKFREHFSVDVVEREIKSFFFIKIKREEDKPAYLVLLMMGVFIYYMLHHETHSSLESGEKHY